MPAPPRDLELDVLVLRVRERSGPDAVYAANLRASAATLITHDVSLDDWFLHFTECWKHELRLLLK